MPLAWAFQRDSELAPLFNYHLDKMQQTGVIDRLHHKFVGDSNNGETEAEDIEVQDFDGLGYEKVTFPFLALLSGLIVACLLLGLETAWHRCLNKVSRKSVGRSHESRTLAQLVSIPITSFKFSLSPPPPSPISLLLASFAAFLSRPDSASQLSLSK